MNRKGKQVRIASVVTGTILLLAGCSSNSASTSTETASGDFSWTQATGSEINVLLVSHPFVDSIQPFLADFEAKTGIKVNIETLAEAQATEKLLADLSTKSGTYDVFMTSPLSNWQYATAGWINPLEKYLDNASLTDISAYDVNDFFPGFLGANKWNLKPLSGLGEGSQRGLPINSESYLLAYRPSVLKAKGLAIPKTYKELIDMAGTLGDGKGSRYGVITRFDKYWDLPYLTFGTMLASYGATLIGTDGKVAVCSNASIDATNDFVSILKKSSPAGAGAFTWSDAMQGFASGQYAMAFNEADLFAPTYQDPKQSKVTKDIGYAVTPEGPAGRKAGTWLWSMSMNSATKNEIASWLFLQWATSPDIMIKTHLNGNMNPVRASAWQDPQVAKLVDSWGETPGQYKDVVSEMGKVAQILYPPHPELTRALDVWAGAIQKTYFGKGTAKKNLCSAQTEITKILGL